MKTAFIGLFLAAIYQALVVSLVFVVLAFIVGFVWTSVKYLLEMRNGKHEWYNNLPIIKENLANAKALGRPLTQQERNWGLSPELRRQLKEKRALLEIDENFMMKL